MPDAVTVPCEQCGIALARSVAFEILDPGTGTLRLYAVCKSCEPIDVAAMFGPTLYEHSFTPGEVPDA